MNKLIMPAFALACSLNFANAAEIAVIDGDTSARVIDSRESEDSTGSKTGGPESKKKPAAVHGTGRSKGNPYFIASPAEQKARMAKQLHITKPDYVVIEPSHGGDAVEVALYTGKGISQGSAKALSRIVRDAPDMRLHRIEASDLRLEVLRKFDLVVFPGGSATQQAKTIGRRGRAEVNRFVRDGGGYLGICAGAYLASSGFPLSCDLIKLGEKHRKPGKPENKSGMSKQKVEPTKKGRALFPNLPAHFQIACVAGPTFPLGKDKRPPPYEPLGIFRTQTASGRGATKEWCGHHA